jgi:hypothetical protein
MTQFTQGRFYMHQAFGDGETVYMLVGAAQKNGAHKAVSIDTYRPAKAKHCSTNYLTRGFWKEVEASTIPVKLLARIRARDDEAALDRLRDQARISIEGCAQ